VLLTAADLVTLARAAVDFDYQGRSVIGTTVKVADLAATMEDRLSALRRYLERHSVRPAGAPFVRYHTFPDIGPDTEGVDDLETDLEEGIPVAEALPGEGRIASGELPVGPVVTTV
jgi:hypothetical protein